MATSDLKVISANCQGLRDLKKRNDVLNYFADNRPDILCLQDTHWLTDEHQLVKKIWQGECLLNGVRSNSRGVAILFGKNIDYKLLTIERDQSGNLLLILLKMCEVDILVINIYAPNEDCPEFFESVQKKIENTQHDHCIVCGDFNLVLNPSLDSYNYKNVNNPRARKSLIQTMNSLCLKDPFRIFNNDLRRYTWHRKNPIRHARLDFFLINQNLIDFIDKCKIKPGYRSDHSNIELLVTFYKFERGRGLWKFNCSLLKDKEYLILINNLIDQEKLKYAVPVYNPENVMQISDFNINFTISDSEFLELLLMQIRGETIRYSTFLKKQAMKEENSLKAEIDKMEKSSQLLDSSELILKKNRLESIRNNKLNSLMLRARAQWLSEGEKPSKYFCSLEKHYYTEKTIRKLVKQNGQSITYQREILEETRNFYANLFKNRDSDLNEDNTELLNSLSGLSKLNEKESNELEGTLTIDEISQALKKMKNFKCPGIDGFPSEFFKVFWVKLKFFVLRSLNKGFLAEKFSISLTQCIISCLPKGDKPRHFLKNWRPVSLLSVVYKIALSALAIRLQKVLHKLISSTQSGFMSNRFIGEGTRLIYDIMHYTQYNEIPGLLMLIDFQKAFDSVSWKFLYTILPLFGFKQDFCKWIKILNTNVKAAVLQSGILSDFFDIQRGCRQGDPISAYLFLLCAQVMFLLIMNEPTLKGIKINGTEFKITQFADDTTLILDGSKQSLLAA